MTDALEDHEGTVSIGGRTITNLRFADDIDGSAGEEEELANLAERLQHQHDLYHVFIDFKKAFDRVWHAALWATMKKYNISANLIQVIKNLYDKATSAVHFNSSIGHWFRRTAGVR